MRLRLILKHLRRDLDNRLVNACQLRRIKGTRQEKARQFSEPILVEIDVTQLQAVFLAVKADADRKNIVLPVESADFRRLCLRNRASLRHLPQLQVALDPLGELLQAANTACLHAAAVDDRIIALQLLF